MSRFYRIVVGAETVTPVGASAPSNNAGATWTNLVNGRTDLGAQTVELDVYSVAFDAPVSQASVRIWGPSKAQISQASDFNGAPIQVFAGMQPGLPLASAAYNAGQSGLILSGQIFQAFGNYQGIIQTLDFVVTSDGGATQSQPASLSFLWRKGQPLGSVIEQTLKIAYPKLTAKVNVSPNLILTQDEPGAYQTLQQFSTYVNSVSKGIIGGTYPGVSVTLKNDVLTVFDGTQTDSQNPVVEILEQDIIGQPTWLTSATISVSTVMRADISCGTQIKLPAVAAAQAASTAASQSNARSSLAFQGTWTVMYARHVGNSRAPRAQDWISTFQAVTSTASPALTSVANSSA